jgi:hypothetical protein
MAQYNGLGTLVHFKKIKCVNTNPTINYPLIRSLAVGSDAYRSDENEHLNYYVDYLKTFCSTKFLKT